ncbi:TetR family transcriptional regulator [Frankia sp. CNm7]|uniref:TetR family transcriptional regulator n=1 Tax=Frankia nepalensis TaxID=1836974 RepID=A0A937RGY3_9ACTN|nr:TetR family transcriptional regulator [Frankia nepalensis]MBL7502712.1 TetR family transcriptional regulator [Frankia nepalensis]MBL7512975.1 TetR family transcriptional regulator [Frankia nepalensis]MBL7519305.1 TetR family transcriptional regulator [Frankia nepalensis]MBL7628780.1 TetR family transcriptional regulator [Frankia nepalensis]
MPIDEAPRRVGRRPGQPETRAEILRAARALFAERGFAGTSIRSVATGAGVDPALVHHYFGSKEGLFRAAMEMPIQPEELVKEIFAAGVEQAPERLVRTFLRVWDDPETGPAMVSFLRTALARQESTSLLREFLTATVVRTAASRLLGGVDPAEAALRIELVASQMIGLAVGRRVLAVEPLASMPADALAAAVTPTITRYLLGELPAPHQAAGNPPA